MTMIIFMIGIVIILILLFLYFHLKIDVKNCAKQIRYIQEENTSMKIGLSTKNKDLHFIVMSYEKQREQYREIYRKEVNLDNELKTLVSNISHDIRTPLTSISGYIEMMETANEDDLIRYKQIISSRLLDMEEMLDTFFQYTTIQAQNKPLDLVETALYPILCEVLLSYHLQFEQHDIIPKIICEEKETLVLIHYESMKRILQNMIINTLRYGSNPFLITLYNSENQTVLKMSNSLDKDTTKTNGNVQIEIEHIFDRFYKGNTSRANKGSGLGMAIVKELCIQMNIDVKATIEDEVLVFTFLFNRQDS